MAQKYFSETTTRGMVALPRIKLSETGLRANKIVFEACVRDEVKRGSGKERALAFIHENGWTPRDLEWLLKASCHQVFGNDCDLRGHILRFQIQDRRNGEVLEEPQPQSTVAKRERKRLLHFVPYEQAFDHTGELELMAAPDYAAYEDLDPDDPFPDDD